MPVSYSKVFEFFINVINEDVITLNEITNSRECISFNNGKLIFSLKGLAGFLGSKSENEYKAFKKMLYSSSLNADLHKHNAKIEVFYSTSKVDTNLYCLTQ